jgi:hypothetical protein
VGDPAEQTTAEEWMAAHHAEQAAEDPYREVHDDTDFTDNDLREVTDTDRTPAPLLETAVADHNQTATADPSPPRRGAVVDDSAASVARARSVLADIHAREQYDHAREAEEQTRWAEPDHDTEHRAARASDDDLVVQ